MVAGGEREEQKAELMSYLFAVSSLLGRCDVVTSHNRAWPGQARPKKKQQQQRTSTSPKRGLSKQKKKEKDENKQEEEKKKKEVEEEEKCF